MSTAVLFTPRFVDVDLSHPAHKSDPYPLYERLRNEAPVCEFRTPEGETAWLVTRYDDVASVLKDERLVKDRYNSLPGQMMRRRWVPSIIKPLFRNMLDSDPPNHTRLRALVQKAFTPRRIEAMHGRIQELADTLLDSIEGRRDFDLIHDFALPLPATVIAEILGVPAKDQHRFHRWSKVIVKLTWSKWDTLKSVPAVWQFLRYVRKLVQKRRAEPADDMISDLIQVRDNGDGLSEDELTAMIFLILIAGHETTVNLVSNGILALLAHPDQLQMLRDQPALIDTAVEELLRFNGPLDTATERYAREELTIGDVVIPAGAQVFACIASANRDEAQFLHADELDITRDPNRHLAFGLGIHFCLGAALARAEAQIAINTLLQRTSQLELAVPAPTLKWRRGMVLRGMKSMPMRKGQ